MRLVTFLLLLIIMATIVVSNEELTEEYKKREEILGRVLKTWEKEILEAQIYHERMKDVPKDERANIDGFSKMLTSAKNKFAALKRRPDFEPDILMPRKTAKTMAERQQKVMINILMMMAVMLLSVRRGQLRQRTRGQSVELRMQLNMQRSKYEPHEIIILL